MSTGTICDQCKKVTEDYRQEGWFSLNNGHGHHWDFCTVHCIYNWTHSVAETEVAQ